MEDEEKLKEELTAFQHLLITTEMAIGRREISSFQISKLDTKIIKEKLDEEFNRLDSAAKTNFAKSNLFFVRSERGNICIATHTKTKLRIYCVRKRV